MIVEKRQLIKFDDIIKETKNFIPDLIPKDFDKKYLISTDESENGDSKILYESESKLVIEMHMKQDQTIYRRLYFKNCPNQIQSEVIQISKTQKKINLDDFNVYEEIISYLKETKLSEKESKSKSKKTEKIPHHPKKTLK